MRHILIYRLDDGVIESAMTVSYSTVPRAPAGMGIWVAGADQWERAVRVTKQGLELSPTAVRSRPEVMSQSAVVMQAGLYRAARREHYDPIPDQLDRVTKALAYLSEQGVDIGEHGRQQVERCQAVKSRFPIA